MDNFHSDLFPVKPKAASPSDAAPAEPPLPSHPPASRSAPSIPLQPAQQPSSASRLQGQCRIFRFPLNTLQLIKKKSGLFWAAPGHQQSLQLRPTYHSLELLFGEAHVVLHYAVILVNTGVKDEGVIRVYRIVSTILPKPVRKSGRTGG